MFSIIIINIFLDLIHTDEFDGSTTLSKLAVFEESYTLLCSVITDVNDPLTKYFVEEKYFTTEEEKQISAITAASEKLQQLMQKISDSLKANSTRAFYMMLRIMKEHGGKATQTLADLIMDKLKISAQKLSYFCINDICVQHDEPKGLFIIIFRLSFACTYLRICFIHDECHYF